MIKKDFIFKAILIVCLYLPSQVWSYPYTEIYVFGDSLSDTGRFFHTTGIPPEPYFEGRISNGKIWVEYLANALSLSYNPQTNFAWAGASSGMTNTWSTRAPDATLSGLQQQIDAYLENTKSADPNALYILWAGSNDFLGDISAPQETISTALSNLVSTVEKLRQHGAQHIMVPNLPNLGKTPTGLASDNSAILGALTQSFNQNLADNLQPFDVKQVDIPAAFDVLGDPNTFFSPVYPNLTDFTTACLNIETETVCDNPKQSFYWDNIHPTTSGHQFISLFFYGAIAEPIYISSAGQAYLAIPLVKLNSETGDRFILNITLSDNPFDNAFLFSIEGSALQSAKSPDSVFNFPSDYDYPSFDNTTGVLHLPVVHLLEPSTSPDQSLPFNVTAKYQVDLALMLNNTGEPLFGLTHAQPLTD
jgi:phospholipase/lecithinase/hemolysin